VTPLWIHLLTTTAPNLAPAVSAMVESQTFVSRRRQTVGRRPRKLFTARGLVKGEVDEQKTFVPPEELSVTNTNPQESPEDVAKYTHPSFVAKEDPRPSEISHVEKVTRTDEYGANPDSSSRDNSGTEASSSHIYENHLEHALQMSCMDSLLFSRATDKSRNRILAFEPGNRHDERNGLPNIFERLSPTQFDMSHILPGRDMVHSKPTGFTCQMPYQNLRDQISEDNIVHGNMLMYQPGNPRRQFAMTMRREPVSSHFSPQTLHLSHVELDVPPSQIYIGEQPCFSDDLIPVDDLPPPASNINLTKYHPKPLIRRPAYAFDRPMFSNDSGDSDQASDVSDENKVATKQSSSPRVNVPTTHTKQVSIQTTRASSDMASGYKVGPSFDQEDDDLSIDKPPREADVSTKLHNEIDDVANLRNDTSPVREKASGSSMATNQSVGEISTDESAASDEAVTSEEPKPKQVGSLHSGSTASTTKKEVTFPGMDDENIELSVLQDENGGPPAQPHLRPDNLEKIDPIHKETIASPLVTLGSRPLPSSKLSSPMSPDVVPHGPSWRRKPFNLVVGTNVQTIAQGDDEFASPNSSIQRSSTPMCKSPRKVTRTRGKPSATRGAPGISRFAYEESFDEAEFFDSTMA
jgi:hypothetical protein